MPLQVHHKNVSRIRVKKFRPVVINLTKSISKKTAHNFVQQLHKAELTGQPFIPVFIHCGGGDVYASFDMVEAMEQSSIPIYTVVSSYAASAAALIFACGSRRFMGPHARLLLHDVWTTIGMSTTSDIKEETREMRTLNRQGFAVMARHAGRPTDYFLNKLGKRRNQDVYVDVDKAIKWGLATDRGVPWVNITYHVDMEIKNQDIAPPHVAYSFDAEDSDHKDTEDSEDSEDSEGASSDSDSSSSSDSESESESESPAKGSRHKRRRLM